ncbi:MAG TPA: HNH endonuclease [Candidatus Saccharimonadales bacterium]|nr:HNH endonuclease [Candidatus Saccharimonadales bacterium]
MGVVDANVLVLNLDYQPLNVCNVRRAVVLLDKQKAVVIEQNGHIVASERARIPSPSVIRLAYHIKRPRPVVKMTRKEVLVRDDHTCQYCGKRGHDLTLDHVIPRHRGGEHTWENVVAACKACNHRKGGRTVKESSMTLARQPFRPPSTPSYLFSSYIRSGERQWFKFLGVEDASAAAS